MNSAALLAPDLSDLELTNVQDVIEAGCRWLRTALENTGRDRFILGLSGGLDSATVALWAAAAVGPERLTLIAMPYGLLHPSAFLGGRSSGDSIDHARLVVNLIPGVDYREFDIAPVVDALVERDGVYEDLVRDPKNANSRLALLNAKARIRAVELYTQANRLNGLVLGTENRTEHCLGYYTRGGDELSDLELLRGLWKVQVRQVARALPVPVPDVILAKAPSADLFPGQTDEGELNFLYDQADRVLDAVFGLPGDPLWKAYMDAVYRDGLDDVPPEVVRRVLDRVRASQFKRDKKPWFNPVALLPFA